MRKTLVVLRWVIIAGMFGLAGLALGERDWALASACITAMAGWWCAHTAERQLDHLKALAFPTHKAS